MKIKSKSISTKVILLIMFSIILFPLTSHSEETEEKKKSNTIKVALLLDTSNSMDGLIAQAKSQLWSIVNKLSESFINNERPDLEIALYEYGNDGLSEENGYIRRVMPFSTDLDLLSEKLFALSTNGGQEYCGQVIMKSLIELDWKGNDNDLRLIFIAGNEPFDQGKISFKEVANSAKNKSIVINPIFCGNFEEGIKTFWKEAASITNGEYMSINHNKKTVYIESPFDDEILKLNEKLNGTYVPYGKLGKSNKQRQENQDSNASSYGKVNTVKRAVSKSKHVYTNSNWDLVDAVKESSINIEEVEKESLPAEIQNLSDNELSVYIEKKIEDRKIIQKEINKLNIKREKYINAHKKADKSLENAILKSIEKQASRQGYRF